MKDRQEWNEGDELWDLLGKSCDLRGSPRFVDDAVRAVKLLPEEDVFWPRILRFSPWMAIAACLILGIMFLMDTVGVNDVAEQKVASAELVDESWVEIEEVAEAEMLVAAADHPDCFSDQELAILIGF